MRLALPTALALALIAPASALADDFYVQQGGTGSAPCAQATPCGSLATAANAGMATGGNIHIIGPYTDNTGAVLWQNEHLLGSGSGPGGTFLDVPGPGLALNMVGNATADAVRVRSGGSAVAVQPGAAITNSAIETTSTSGSAVSAGPGAGTSDVTLDGDTITGAGTGTGAAVSISPGGFTTAIHNSTLTGATGVLTIFGGIGANLVIQRSTIDASSTGLSLSGVAAFVSSSVIHMTGADSKAVSLTSVPGGGMVTAKLIEDTVDGADTSGSSVGVEAGPGGIVSPLGTQAAVTDSIVRGFGTDLKAHASISSFSSTAPGVGDIAVQNSDIGTRTAEPASSVPPPGSSAPGIITDAAGNLNVDPGFVNRAGGDYSLRTGSPLIDAAGTAPVDTGNNESATDRAGRQRILDGDGNGTAARDMGAFEYAFRVVDTGTAGQAVLPPTTPHIVQQPKPPALTFKLFGGGTLLFYPPNVLRIPVSCGAGSPSACAFQVVVQTTGPVVTTSRAKKKKGKVLTLGRGHATIAPGKSGTIKVKLSKAAVKLFKSGKLRKVSVLAHLGNTASAKSVEKTYKLKAAPKKRKH